MKRLLTVSTLFIAVSVAFAGDSPKALTKEDVAGLFTSEIVTKHYENGRKAAGKRTVEKKEDDLYVSFSAVTIRVGTGGTFFTAKDAEEAKDSLFSAVLGDALSPDIGLRAHIFGIEDDILVFTTNDGKFDIRVEPAALTPEMDVVGIGREISNAYDQKTKPAEQDGAEQPATAPESEGEDNPKKQSEGRSQ